MQPNLLISVIYAMSAIFQVGLKDPVLAAVYISEINNSLELKVDLLWYSGALGGSAGPVLCSSL